MSYRAKVADWLASMERFDRATTFCDENSRVAWWHRDVDGTLSFSARITNLPIDKVEELHAWLGRALAPVKENDNGE